MTKKILCAIAIAAVGLSGQVGAAVAGDLLENGSFDQVLEHWGVDPAMGSWVPYQHPGGYVGLDPNAMNFHSGPIISQPLNVAGVADQSITISIDVGSDWEMSPGHSVGVWLDYLDGAGERQRALVLNPDNAAIPSGGFATFQDSYLFPADAVRLVGLTISREEEVWGAIVDNVGLFSDDGLVAGPVPSLHGLSPTAIAYGGTLTIHGREFGAVPGVVRVGGETNGVMVQTWSDETITAAIGEACVGGLVRVEALGARTVEKRSLAITSSRFALTARPEGELALAGQSARVDVRVAFKGGFTTGGGITLSTPDHPSASVFSRNPVMRDGGALLTFDTTGLSTGVHQIVVRATEPSSPVREATFDIDIREVDTCALDLDGTVFTAQQPQMATLSIMDTMGNDISYDLPWPTWSSSASEIGVFQEPAMWGSLYVLPHATGSATLQATLPDGVAYSFGVSADIPAAPSIVAHTVDSWVMSNGPAETNLYYCGASSNMTHFSYSTSAGLQFHNSWWGEGNRSYSIYFTANGAMPGTHMIRGAATMPGGGASDGILIQVVNNPAMGLLNGRVVQFDGDMHQEASGYLEFHDPAGGMLFDREVWSHSADFTLPSVPPGDYHLRFVSDSGDEDWWPNADSNTATTVAIAAGAVAGDLIFTFGADDAPAPDPEIVAPPSYDPATGAFGFSVQSEMNVNYQFIKSTTLRDGSWYVLESLWGDGSTLMVEDTNTPTHAFYRVVPE